MLLQGKRIVVTGASGALGQATVARARAHGAEVIPLCRRAATADAIAVDLSDRQAVQRAFQEIAVVDGLCNVAGGFAMGDFDADTATATWQRMQTMNVDTLRNATAAVLPGMLAQGRGAIVNVGAIGALQGQAQMSAYGASKAAVMHLTESLSAEYRERGININAVLPSTIDTPANREAMPEADFSRWVSTEQLAEVMCFLLSEAASGVHGALLPVRGLS